MAEIGISVAAKVAEKLVGPAIRGGKCLLCVNKVVRDLEKETEKLKSERDSLQDRVKQALERTEVIEKPVEKWLDGVGKLVKEAEDLDQKMKANTSCFQGRFPTWRRYRLCRQMIKKKEAMGEFKGKSNIQPFAHRAPLPGIQYQSSPNFTYFKATTVAFDELRKALEDDCINMIGVYGMGGCGKTTLVTEVGKWAEESNKFDKVILITVSQTPNISRIQGKMASRLNFNLDEDGEEERAERLWLSLKERKRILVIVDDLWEKFDLKHIGIRFDNVNKGTWKILVTTRNQSVCASMDCQKNIHLGLLSEEESRTLFHQHAKIDDKFSESLNGVLRELCEECKGLPMAIIAIASSLKGKHEAEWEAALIKLRNSEEYDEHDKGVSATLRCLELSYKYLQNKEAELLFFMCSMFPEDYNIFVEDLILFAIGLGVGGRSSLKSKRSLIQAGINKLLDSCLLMHVEDEDMQCVKMHDLVRDTALWIAKRSQNRKILVNIDKPLDTLAEDDSIRECFAISSWWYNEDPSFSQLHAPNLEMLLLDTSISSDRFDLSGLKCERLQVFSLTYGFYTYIPRVPVSLPSSTQLLKNVQTLRLNGLQLGDISFIASLVTLEVLHLRGCDFNELPGEIGRLRRLKLLDLSSCHIFQNNYNGAIGKCSQLEELYASEYDREEEYLHQSIMDIVTLPKLQRFVIDNKTWPGIAHKSTRALGLMDFNFSKLRKSEKNILQIAESVVLKGLHGGYKNIIPDIVRVVGGMNDLASLALVNCPGIECIFDTTSDSKVDNLIPTLVKLLLDGMENLKELCRGPPLQVLCFFEKLEILQIENCMQLHNIFSRECNLKNLKELRIEGCTSAEVLFPTSVGQSLQQLESLEIGNCDELKHIIASGREHGGCNTSKEIVPAHFPMPRLRKVRVSRCHKLESIFPVSYVEGLERLQNLRIWDTPELKYVFGECDHEHHSSQQYQNYTMLPYLEVLVLAGLENLVGMCPEYCHAKWPSQSLRKLTVNGCPKLDTSWITVMMTSSNQRQYRLNENLPLKLQELDLTGLPQLSPTPWQIWSLQFLQHLTVVNCKKLKCLFSMELCGNLQELTCLFIGNCQELEQIVAANEEPVQLPNTEAYFPKLKEIQVKRCTKLKSLFPVTMVRMLPQLSIIDISSSYQLEEVFRDGREDGTTNQTEVVLPNLTQIALSYLPCFVDICQGRKLQAVKLQELSIYRCAKIDPSLKPTQVAQEAVRDDVVDFLAEIAYPGISSEVEDPDSINEAVRSHPSTD